MAEKTGLRPIVFVRWAGVVLWAGVIVFMSSQTSTDINAGLGFFSEIARILRTVEESIFGSGVDVLSVLGHFFEYFILSFLLVNALWQHMSLKRACVVAIVCSSLFGITDELHQYFVPGRMCDPLDWAVDTIAATVGAIVARPVLKRVDAAISRTDDTYSK
ncbi:MAG: VanZ family protein [Raoultibacter sp.]